MKDRLIIFIKTYVIIVCLFVVQKPLFMCIYHTLFSDVALAGWFEVIWHGLALDFSLAGYLTAIPALLLIVSVWTVSPVLRNILRGYFVFVSALMSIVAVTDAVLYEYWGFRLDSTPLFYFFTSPKDVFASVSIWLVVAGLLVMAVYAVGLYAVFNAVLLRKSRWLSMTVPYRRIVVSVVMLIATGLLFIPIRGGFTVSTMNTGKVYFSSNQRLNHAAINPMFSLMESMLKQNDFASQYRFMQQDEADGRFTQMLDPAVLAMRAGKQYVLKRDSSELLFKEPRPDVLVVILESFSSHLMKELGGVRGVAVNLDSLAHEGVLFTNFYANSFRTDRGLMAILSGYPAQPTTSIIKYPRKTQSIPSLARALRKVGYDTKFYYGGDADFFNMRSYLMSSGFQKIVSDRDFPISERLSKWGVHDHLVFRRLLDDMKTEPVRRDKPCFRVLQTSSSHEPFEVPFHRLANARLNAFAYTDSCVGDFVRRFRSMPQWEHTVIVFVPDHLGAYPESIDNLSTARYEIPLLMIGGALKSPRRIDVYGSQQDLAATLLAQLGLPHGEFTFSKDMMNPASPHFAFFTFPDAFGLVSTDGRVVYDNQAGRTVFTAGSDANVLLMQGKAYLQKLYDDIAAR